MNKQIMKCISLSLVFCLLLTFLPSVWLAGRDASPMAKAEEKTYKVGDIITFGGYPQSEVTARTLVEKLNTLPKSWKSCQYYSGTGSSDGQMQPGNWMRYADVFLNGAKYRAVTFDNYRPSSTSGSIEEPKNLYAFNGYEPGNIYYFRFESLQWRVLDPENGLVLCESIIDSQAFQNTVYQEEFVSWQDASRSTYVNNYAESSLRQWLTHEFYDTAFSDSEKALIAVTPLENRALTKFEEDREFDSEPTEDTIFLLSYFDILNASYGFLTDRDADDVLRRRTGTDYAKSQGLAVYTSRYTSDWWLRTASSNPNSVLTVASDGGFGGGIGPTHTDTGVRPAFCFLSGISQSVNPNGGEGVPDGGLPGDVNADGAIGADDARLALRRSVDLENYPYGSAAFLACDVNGDKAVGADDARLILRASVDLEDPTKWKK